MGANPAPRVQRKAKKGQILGALEEKGGREQGFSDRSVSDFALKVLGSKRERGRRMHGKKTPIKRASHRALYRTLHLQSPLTFAQKTGGGLGKSLETKVERPVRGSAHLFFEAPENLSIGEARRPLINGGNDYSGKSKVIASIRGSPGGACRGAPKRRRPGKLLLCA